MTPPGRRGLSTPLRTLACLVAIGSGFACSPERPPDVILIVMDTTRADRLSVYGHARETTPNLEAFAREAIRFDRAYATSSWTLASHASLFTGLYPMTHQATQENLRLDAELDTLAELLGRTGYQTAAFTNNSWISDFTQLSQGFDHVAAMWRDAPEAADDEPHPTNRAALQWLAERDPDRPAFLFLNYMEAHWPYAPPERYRERFPASAGEAERGGGFPAITWYLRGGNMRPELLPVRERLYDSELAYLDAILGELLHGLRERLDLDDTLIVVTADHGENLGEHGHQGHSFSLYDSTLRIPLLIRAPGARGAGTVRTDPVQLTDVFKTIAARAGISDFDPRATGVDLLTETSPEDRPVVGEYYYPKTFLNRFPDTPRANATLAPFKRRLRSIQIGPDKLIWGSDGRHELYRIDADPSERNDLAAAEPERVAKLEAELEQLVEALGQPVREVQRPLSELSEDEVSNLRALGYIP